MKKQLQKVSPSSITTPYELIAIAVQQNADVDKLEKLMHLQERYDANEAKKAFVTARAGFSGESVVILKTAKGHNSKYAKLGDELEIVTPLLSKHGLSHSWVTNQDNGMITVTCVLTHEQGHSESTSLSSSPETSGSKNAIQAIGSAVSYLKRYTFEAICGLATTDDDGQSTQQEVDENLPTVDKVDYNKVNTAILFFKREIDKDNMDNYRTMQAAWDRLNPNEQIKVSSGLYQKPKDSKKKYKNILVEYISYAP